MAGQESKTVKVKSVSLTVYPWKHRSGKIHWRFDWHDPSGKRRQTTRADKDTAIRSARDRARMIHNQTFDLATLTDEQARLCRAFLDLSPTWSDIERLRSEKVAEETSVKDAFALFIEAKRANAGNSPHNVTTLKNRVGNILPAIERKAIASVTVSDLDRALAAGSWEPSTKLRIRASLVTFFRWCRNQGMLPDRTTEAEKMAKPIVIKKAPSTYSPDELTTMLDAVQAEFRPWLVLSAWAGIRREELYPNRKSKKSALAWEDIDLSRKIITIRPEVSKTNERRIIPMCDALALVLAPLVRSERVTGQKTPTDSKNGVIAETKRLGELVGGWKPNALRHSFVSYRCAQVGVGMAAMEAGNSEAETRRSYRDAKSEEEAAKWFAIREPSQNPKREIPQSAQNKHVTGS